MSSTNLSLDWADFETFTKRTVCNLLDDTDFTDVTLVCGDNRQIKAHKSILSACSPFFKTILKNNPHQHPLIYLRGVDIEDLKALVYFMYKGKAEVPQERLGVFIALSSEFRLEGIGNLDQEPVIEPEIQAEIEPEIETIESEIEPIEIETMSLEIETHSEPEIVSTEEHEANLVIESDREELTQRLRNALYETRQLKTEERQYQANPLCETEDIVSKTQPSETCKFACGRCDFQSNNKGHLRTHISSVHEAIRYSCNQCEYKATQRCHLTRHRRNRHTSEI